MAKHLVVCKSLLDDEAVKILSIEKKKKTLYLQTGVHFKTSYRSFR